MRWSTRVLFSSLAAILVPLVVLAVVGLPSVSSQLSQSVEADLQRWARTVSGLVAATLEDLQREARLLARDPAIIQGVAKSDWGTLARGGSSRMLALTLERVADLILIVDERGAPLVQVPAPSGPAGAGPPIGSPAPIGTVRFVSGVPMLLGAVPIVQGEHSVGTVVVGRKFDGLARQLGAHPLRVELLVLAEGAPTYTTLPEETSGVRWAEATRGGRVELRGSSYFVRSVGRWADVGLWLLAPDAGLRATKGLVGTWIVGFLLFAACATFVAAWILTRRVLQPLEAIGEGARRVAAGDFDTRVPPAQGGELGDLVRAFNEMGAFLQRWRREVEHRNRELEALNAVALTLNRTIDFVPTVEETLEVVRRVTEMEVAALYQADEGGQTLSLVAQRGVSPELAESLRIPPAQGTDLGRAMRTGRPTVVHALPAPPLPDGHQTQLALPIPVRGGVWGVMILVDSKAREFSSEETQLMEAVAYQVGAAVERASLFAETREKGQRLESLVGLAQTVTARPDLGEVLAAVVQAASGLIPESSVRLWVAEEDRLILRRESGTEAAAFGGRKTTFAFGEGLTGHVAQTAEPLVVERVIEDPRTINVEWMGQEGYVSFAGVPLLFQNRVLGVLAILTRRLHRFTKEEIELLVSFATQAAITIENARLYAEASRSAAEHQALFDVAGLVGSTLKVERVLDVIVERARALLNVRAAGIFEVDAASNLLVYQRGIGLSPEFIRSLCVRVGEGTSGKAVQYCAPAWSSDLLNDPTVSLSDETRTLVAREGYRAVLSVPILVKGNPYGVLAVYWWEEHSPAFFEVRLLSALAGQAAVALDNAQLYEAATRRGKRLETLAALTQTLTATLRVEEVLNRVVGSAVELFGSSVSRLWLVDENGETLSLRAHAGSVAKDLGVTRFRVGEGLVGRIVATKAPLVVADLREDPRAVDRERHRTDGAISYAGAPMLLGDRAVGALGIALRELHEFSEEEVSLLQSLANHAAIAIENARLYQAAARRAARMRTLAEMGRLLVSTFDMDRILETVTTRCRENLDITDMGIFFLDEEHSEIRFHHGFGSREVHWRTHRLRVGEGVAGRAVAENRPVWTEDVLNDPSVTLGPETRARIETIGTRAVLAIPLSGERAFGALVVHREAGYRFTDEEKEYLATFANQVAVALENARLFSLEQTRRAQVEALEEIERELAVELHSERLLDLIIQRVSALLNARGIVFLLDESGQTLAPKSWYGMPAQVRDLRIPVGVGIAGTAAAERRGLVANDFTSSPYAASIVEHGIPTLGSVHLIAQPLISRDRLLGVITLNREEGKPGFIQSELETFRGFAAQAAIALENARLYREAKEYGERLRALDQVNRLVSSSLQVEEVLKNIAQAASTFFEAPQAHVWVVTPDGQRLRRSVTVGDPAVAAGFAEELAVGEAGVGWVAQHGEPILWTRMDQDRRIQRARWALRHGLGYLTAYPITLRDRVLGAFVMYRAAPHPVTSETRALLGSLAAQAAVALDNARLYAETARKLEEMSVLHELSRAVTGQLDLAELVSAIRRQVGRVLDARNMLILLYDEADQEVEVALRMLEGEERPEPRRHPAGDGLFMRLVERRRPIRTDDYAAECRREGVRPVEGSLPYPFWLGVPMVAGDQPIGGLILRSNARPFTADDERLLMNIAGLAALAFRSARLFDERSRAFQELAEAQDQLVRTEKLRALGEMASGVAHDFNNLLASILGRTQLLLRKVEDPKLQQWLQVIERAATDGAQTVRRIQEFARIRRDQPFVTVDLNGVVKEALEVTQSRWGEEAQSQGVTIEVTTTLDPVPVIAGDPAELREALTNLILNAVDAMPEGGRLSLTTEAAASHVVVKVSDTGVGISEEVQRHIFDPFFSTKGPKGTGLGLSIAYGIVSRHGGQIAIESAEGRGSTFALTFPVNAAEPERPASAVLPATSPVRCLVVDDEQLVLEALGDLLATAGHSVVLVADGGEAIERFKAEPFDLVLTDLAMPGVNGWQLARAVKDHTRSVPVLLVTGYGVELSHEELLAHGVDAVLSKPVKLEDILSAVTTFGSRRQRERPAPIKEAS